jgi:nitroreductase / dihydropteridine reductase
MDLIKQLQWRYASKRMTGTKVPADKLEKILEAIRLAPTSVGLQPFQVIVVDDKAIREKIHEAACKQPQVLESSQLLVFAARESLTDTEIDDYIQSVAETRDITIDKLEGLKVMVSGLKGMSATEYPNWSARQAYIALGVGLAAAAVYEVDATPMEGFDKPTMDKVLGLKEMGLRSAVLMAVGYRDEKNDRLANAKKVRKTSDQLFIRV